MRGRLFIQLRIAPGERRARGNDDWRSDRRVMSGRHRNRDSQRTSDRSRPGRSRRAAHHSRRSASAMISPPAGTRIWLAAGITDMRRGMNGLAVLVQSALREPVLRPCLPLPRPAGRSRQTPVVEWRRPMSIRQTPGTGAFRLAAGQRRRDPPSAAQLSMLLEGIDWRRPERVPGRHNTRRRKRCRKCAGGLSTVVEVA